MAERTTASRMSPPNDASDACERTAATLLIYPGDMPPSEISELLCLQPTSSVEKGVSSAPNSLSRVRIGKLNGWFLTSEDSVRSRDVRRHLDWLLDAVEPAAPALLALQNTDGVQMRVNCIWWAAPAPGGPVLWPEQMRRLAALNLELSFDVAFYGDADPTRDP